MDNIQDIQSQTQLHASEIQHCGTASQESQGNSHLHPEGKITLLNGAVIDGYYLEELPKEYQQDRMELDKTGQYLVIGRHKPNQPKEDSKEEERRKQEEKLFTDNAFFLLGQADRIFRDSRMFLAPIPIQSGLAYIGTGGLRNPTLGIYLEWWLNSGSGILVSKKGKEKLVYHIAGSPLSGRNHCACVDRKGKCRDVQLPSPFSKVWRSFMQVNTRYTIPKQQYAAYTLQEVIDILKRDPDPLAEAKSQIAFLTACNHSLAICLEEQKKLTDDYRQQLHTTTLQLHRKELQDFVSTYRSMQMRADSERDLMVIRRRQLKEQLKAGDITNKEYQYEVHPMTERKKELDMELSHYYYDTLNRLMPGKHITIDEIEKFLSENDKQQ